MTVLAAVLILAMLGVKGVAMVRAQRQRQAVAEHAAAVLRRDWVQELRS
jgi:hypothetical protein